MVDPSVSPVNGAIASVRASTEKIESHGMQTYMLLGVLTGKAAAPKKNRTSLQCCEMLQFSLLVAGAEIPSKLTVFTPSLETEMLNVTAAH